MRNSLDISFEFWNQLLRSRIWVIRSAINCFKVPVPGYD